MLWNRLFIDRLFAVTLALFLQGGVAFCQADETETESPAEIASKGDRLLDEGKAADAYRIFASGLEKFPGAAGLLTGAGRALLQSGYADKSVEVLFKAIGSAPESYEANLYLGKALRRHGIETAGDLMTQNEGYMMIEDALKFLRKAAALDAKAHEPCLELAYTLYDLSALDEAEEAAAKALERRPGLVEALLLRGDLAYVTYRNAGAAGEPADAVRVKWRHAMDFYDKALAADRENARACLGIAALYEADKKWDASADAYREALVREPELLNGYNQLITIFRRESTEGEEEKEKISLSDCLENILIEIEKRYPGDGMKKATPLYYIGFARFLESDFEEAMKAYAESAKLNPSYATGAAYYRGRALFELGLYDDSVKLFLETQRKDPEGLAYFMQGDNEFTRKVYPSLSYLASHLVNAGKFEDAMDLTALILQVVENDAALYNNYAFLCRETGRYEASYTAYLKAIELDPTNPSLLNDAALILHYHLHRDGDEAERLYKKSAEEAKRFLSKEGLNQAEKDEYKIALRDATNNLRLLKKGVTEDPEAPPKGQEDQDTGREDGTF